VTLSRDRYDIVVVGAGALGLASAYHLSRECTGETILVVDALKGPGEGSTGASAAMVRDVFSSSDNRSLAGDSIAFYRSIQSGGVDLGLDLYGYLWMLPQDLLHRYHSLATKNQRIAVRPIQLADMDSCPGLNIAPSGELAELVKVPDIVGGLFGSNCGAVAPEKLARFYHDEAAGFGVETVFGKCVTRLSFEGGDSLTLDSAGQRPFSYQEHIPDRVRISRVRFDDGTSVAAGTVIVAAGAWANQLLDPIGFASWCSARRRQLFALGGTDVEALLDWSGPTDASGNSSPRGCPFIILPTGAYIKPLKSSRRIWLGFSDHAGRRIGTEERIEDGGLTYNPLALGEKEFLATDVMPMVAPYFPCLERANYVSGWGGYFNYSPDGLPWLEQEYGIVFVGGDSGSGVMKADSIGRLVAASYRGKKQTSLFAGTTYDLSRLSVKHRHVEPEEINL
jgi:FAD-dependent oxidoreductase domain-containing protein 1